MTRLTSQGYGDFIVLGGEKSPGLCDVSGASSPRKWDQVIGYGISGASSRFLGIGLSEFSVKFRLYGAQDPPSPDWQAWNLFQARVLMKPPAGTHARALDIAHPELVRLKIKSVGVVDVGQAYQSDAGEWTIEVKFIEFRRPQFTLAKPEASKATTTDPYDRINEGIFAQVEAAAKG